MKLSRIVIATLVLGACSRDGLTAADLGRTREAATAAPTLATIAVDGTFADWQQVMLNPLQVTVDGNGLSGGGCYPTNPDRDCEAFTTQRDITQFAWTYDGTNIYTRLIRPTSNATLTYSFIMDVDADGLAETSDFVLQVEWKTGGRALAVKLFEYVPANSGGDSMACPDLANCPSTANPHGEVGFVDGYTLPGTTGTEVWSPPAPNPACTGSGAGDECGGDGIGTQFEVSVPWIELGGLASGSPIIWHVASSTNTKFNQATDNLGGPDGRLGTFGVFGVDFTDDLVGSANSPGSVDYCHTVTNTGNFRDTYNLSAISSTGSQVTFFAADANCNLGAQMAVDPNGDGVFLPADVAPAFDSNSDGRPDTGQLTANQTFKVIIRVTLAGGLSGSTDQLVGTARSVARPVQVFDTVTDRTRVGAVTVVPDLARSGTPGLAVDFGPHIVTNNQLAPDTFNLFVRSSRGYTVALYTDVGGAPGAFIAQDTNGDGTWDTTTPNTGALGSGASANYWVKVTVPVGATVGTVDTVTLTATSQVTPTATGSAVDTLTVRDGLTITPSYTAPSSQLIGPAGSSVYLPHTIINSLGVSNTVSLSQTGTLAAGYTIRWWTDPNGDGSIADGALITAPFALAAFGGVKYIVTEITIPASGTPSSTAAATTATGQFSTTATANDHVSVGGLQTFEDALFTQPTRSFQACATIYAQGVGLTPLQTTNYQLRFSDPSDTTKSNANMPTNNFGVGNGSYTLAAGDAIGSWRVRIFSGPTQIYDLNPVVVERSGTVTATAPAVAVNNQPLAVSAQLTNTATQAAYTGTSVTFELLDTALALMATKTVSVADVAAGSSVTSFGVFPNVSYPAFGTYTVRATWKTSCGSTIQVDSTTVPYAAPAPTLLTPANGASVGTTTPTLTGTAEAGATVRIYIDGVLSGTATGAAFSYVAPAQTVGSHSWYATQVVGGAVSPASTTFTFVVDTTAPSAPTVLVPADGSRTNNPQPTISGTAEALSTVRVYLDGNLVGTVPADTGGAWTYTLTSGQALAEGPYTATATATDAANNTSGSSAGNTFTVDLTAPAKPVVTAPADGSTTADSTPTIAGTAEPGSTVRVSVDGNLVGTVTANSSGAWSYTLTSGQALSSAGHTASATATDAAGNVSQPSNTNGFTVDPGAVSVVVVVDPADGALVGTGTPTVSGTSNPNDKIDVKVNGVVQATVFANGSGVWTYTLTAGQSLADGVHTASAQGYDSGNNPYPPSNVNTFTVDTTPPSAPVLLAPDDGATTNATPTVSGTADPGSTVKVSVNGNLVGTVVADSGGAWSYTLQSGQELPEGPHTVDATATDPAGNTSGPSTTINFTVDTTAPNPPSVVSPADGAIIGTSRPTIRGTAEANASVTVRVDSQVVATVPADGTGAWTYTLTTTQALAEGAHTTSATATDSAGNTSLSSTVNGFTVDLTAPQPPTIGAPGQGSTTGDSTPTITGTAEPGSTVTVSVDGQDLGTAVAATDGSWTFTPTSGQALTDGDHTVVATATDAGGNTSGPSASISFTVDTTAPQAPVVSAPADNSVTASARPTVAGTAEPGATVTVTVDSTVLGTAVTDGSGNWSYNLTSGQSLQDGLHTASATATDAGGNTSGVSNTVSFTVDTGTPQAPVISSPANGGAVGTATPTISGTAEAGSTVTVTVDGQVVGTAVAASNGTWSYTLTSGQVLSEGSHTVTATATDPAGNTSTASGTVNFTVDLTAPGVPVVSAPADGALLSTRTPTVSGTAEPDATVIVTVDGQVVGTVAANSSGAWSYTLTSGQSLADGSHTVSAVARDAAGNSSASSADNTFTVDGTAPSAPVVSAPTDGASINTPTPTVTGTAAPDSSVAVTVDGQVVGTVTANSSGAWTYTLTSGQSLADGSHQVSATATDAAGNTSPASSTNTFTVDTVAPAAPAVTAPADGASIATHTPTVTGTAAPNSSVAVTVDGQVVGTVTASSSGAWSYTLTSGQSLADGSHQVSATATDAAGNTSAASPTNTFTVDTAAPAAPVITSPADGATVNPTLTVTGTAEPGATVSVVIDGQVVGTATADQAGAWSFDVTQPLADGSHTVSGFATDPAGNAGPNATAVTVTVAAPTDGGTGDGGTGGGAGDGGTGDGGTGGGAGGGAGGGQAGGEGGGQAGGEGGGTGGNISFAGGGCGCAATGPDAGMLLWLASVLGVLARRRRKAK